MLDTINRLRTLNVDRNDLDELVALDCGAENLAASYAHNGLPTPEWLAESHRTVKREIAERRRDALLRERKQLEIKGRSLMTREEQREELTARLAAIDKLLGVTTPAAPATASATTTEG